MNTNNNNIGPGTYYRANAPVNGPAYTFPVTSHLTDNHHHQNNNIGPGTYYRSEHKMEGPSYSFPTVSHLHNNHHNNNGVGPGTYYRSERPASGPSYSFPVTTHISHQNNLKDSSRTFPQSPTNYTGLQKSSQEVTPGPGHYHSSARQERSMWIPTSNVAASSSFPKAPTSYSKENPKTVKNSDNKKNKSEKKTDEKATLQKLKDFGYPVHEEL
ncbi:hypothetical protein AGDE_16129 [Angomonas deanei]|uniref:Uncharacterized protein n=1 Tax=Angomonas deanei TaxID=59799 RepID=A0A7G2CT50_9TRYP|nr:hypothetical protein AGDE_16129 [Angomonas deanei]CAD2222449.1 hypothetical protein, conserved [Angomonas deanei]|eukprot:EPY17660.1 hypothetical protein AGDE_16129 [Angomonas deanei]